MTDDVVREILNITAEDITKLKKMVAKDEQNANNEHEIKEVAVTTLEVLADHIWRARCRALKLNPEGTTHLGLVVSIHGIMEPALPEGYYGNAFVSHSVALTARELSELPLSCIVRLIKYMKREALDKRYVLGKLKETENNMLQEMTLFEDKGGRMSLTDWRQIGLQYDGLVNNIPLVPMTMTNLTVLLPASKVDPGMKGGARLLVTLPRKAMTMFKEEMKNAF